MPVSPNNLITVINKNKNKKLIATKIIETNPKVLPVVSKLTQNRELSSSIENDDFKVNRGLLEDLYNRIRTVQQNNTQIIQLFPDIELSIQILVSSILSPKKMTDIQLNYKFNKNITINPSISSKVLETIKTCTLTYGKFAYVSAHYPPRAGHLPGTKRYVTTKGKEHTNIIEESFSTVVETVMEDRQFYFEADVFDSSNTTKTKMVDGFFKIPRKSIDDLEQVLNKRKHVVDGKLVEV